MKKTLQIFGLIATLLLATGSAFAQTTTTFGFESQSELSSFTIQCENSNGSATVATDKKKNGNSSLKAVMGGTSKKGIYVTTTSSYQNITALSFYLASSDKGKTSLQIQYCASSDFSSGVTDIQALDLFTALPGVPASPSNNTFYQVQYSFSTPISGYLRFYFYQPQSSGKTMWMDDLAITTGGGSTPPGPGPSQSNDATLSALKVNGASIQGFSANTYTYNVTLPAGTTTVPTVTATAHDANAATPVITNATSLPGTTTIQVTAEDGTTTLTYTINFTVESSGGTDPTPSDPSTPTVTNLTLHETEVYESPTIMGGYGGTLSTYNNREYEVYYVNRNSDSKFSINLTNTDKMGSITTSLSDNVCQANDGWFIAKQTGSGGDTGLSAQAEFLQSIRKANMRAGDSLVLHIKGYSEFAMAAADKKQDTKGNNPDDNKYFEVYVDGQKQASQFNTNITIRRYPISTGEHVIKVLPIGTDNSKLLAFSLQVAYVPKVKYVAGNDSNQVVLQTNAIKPIKYFIKNKLGAVDLVWNGPEATGISLQANAAGDTVTLQGTANCAVGTYNYTITAKDNAGNIASQMSGSFSVEQKVTCLTTNLLNMTVYEKTAITPVEFRCYVLNMGDVTPKWLTPQAPGLSFSTDPDKHKITLSGTPTTPGTYTYAVILGTDSILGSVTVESNSPTIVPGASSTLLFLYKSNKEDGILGYIKASRKYSYFARPTGGAMGAEAEYAQFNAIVISEDVDANNEEVLGIIRSLNKPVLNMKAFTYSKNRLNWGDPDNGSITNKKLTIQQRQHPIFGGTLAGKNDLTLLDSVAGNKGLMPIEVNNYPGTICLAAAPTRGDNYDDDGDYQTFIHEVPASMRGAKYLSYPISSASTAFLTADAKVLFDNMIAYLTNPSAQSVALPTLKIESLKADDVIGQIDEANKTITVQMPANTNLAEVRVELTLADATTHSTPESGSVVDFSDYHYGVTFTVSDYINVVKYTVKVLKPSDLEGIESDGLWFADETLHNNNGVWVNIFSVDGQLITTTNSEFSFAGMPRGLYLIRSANASLKIMH